MFTIVYNEGAGFTEHRVRGRDLTLLLKKEEKNIVRADRAVIYNSNGEKIL